MISRKAVPTIFLLTIKFAFSEDSVWHALPDHETPYHQMLKTKEEFRCELNGPQYHHHNGACVVVENAHRNLAVVRDNAHEFQALKIFETGSPDASDGSPACTGKGCYRAKIIKLKVATDAPEVEYHLDDEGVEEENKDSEWSGVEIIASDKPDGIVPGTATFIRSATGAVTGSVSSNEHGIVIDVSTRQKGKKISKQYVEVISQTSFPEELESQPNRQKKKGTQIKRKTGRSEDSQRNLGEERSIDDTRNLQRGDSVISLMVVYTKKAMCADAGKPYPCLNNHKTTIENRIDLGVSQLNEALRNSNGRAKVKLVKVMSVDYDETPTWSSILSSVSRKQLDKTIYNNRDYYKADLVHMVMAKGGYCGYGYIRTNKGDSFSLSNYKCATGMYSLAHEISHNLGCDHNRENASSYYNSYAYGFQDPGKKFRTLMAYSCDGANCPRILRFSHHSKRYEGRAIGSRTANNAKQIRSYSKTVKNFY
eukprot:CAMPEP_0194271390 /NCGR_PEP_ID=MMETSP0169-20130528/5178_1 /TAXON_ID=218684 /ORGANISM="Corethron pennatum, Strain L29A3" /LENGTH=480 /DNA_ID=CAMNT_0039013719 /DNA_START=340 /DNA_END=1782 /DNA_ORIENTATION=+